MALKVSQDVMFKIVDDVIARGIPQGFSKEQNYALSVYIAERGLSGDLRMFQHTHPNEFAELAKLSAEFIPGARTMSEFAATVTEAEVDALKQIWLTHRFQQLAEAVDQSEKEKNYKPWFK